jgi:hypothetical protein
LGEEQGGRAKGSSGAEAGLGEARYRFRRARRRRSSQTGAGCARRRAQRGTLGGYPGRPGRPLSMTVGPAPCSPCEGSGLGDPWQPEGRLEEMAPGPPGAPAPPFFQGPPCRTSVLSVPPCRKKVPAPPARRCQYTPEPNHASRQLHDARRRGAPASGEGAHREDRRAAKGPMPVRRPGPPIPSLERARSGVDPPRQAPFVAGGSTQPRKRRNIGVRRGSMWKKRAAYTAALDARRAHDRRRRGGTKKEWGEQK